MDLETIFATLALLGTGAALPACDGGKKDATEVDKSKADAKAADGKADAKADAKAGEMACGAEGACGAGACGGAKDADAKDADADAKADGADAKDKS
jgi:hypothetical protein